MKSSSIQQQNLRVHYCWTRNSRRHLSALAAAVGLTVLSSLSAQTAILKESDACARSSQAVRRSCLAGAESDYALAIGKCANVSGPSAGQACQDQALADLQDAQLTCQAQFDARHAACEKLGDAPYDPTIDPANFVARIDNPYFPLRPGTTYIYEGNTTEGFEHDELP